MVYGVPNMKADKEDVVLKRTRIMEREGVIFICGEAGEIGSPTGPSAKDLLRINDAVVLATGATVGRDMNAVPGRDLKGVHLAMEFLHANTKAILDGGRVGKGWRDKLAASPASAKPFIDVMDKRVVIIGGGDTGNDCIGTSVRQGARAVNNLELLPKPPPQRAASTPWPHWPTKLRTDYGHEEAAQVCNGGEDIRTFSVQTKQFLGDANGHVTGVQVVDVEWKMKDSRMQMVEKPGSERVIGADNVFLALGFLGPEASLAQQFGVKVDQGKFQAPGPAVFGRRAGYRTSNPKVFAAGDCRRGQSLVVWGIAEGRQAAVEVHNHVMASSHAHL